MGVYLVDILSKANIYNITVTSRSQHNEKVPNARYIKGNARDEKFLKEICKDKWDVIVDFMNYDLLEFQNNMKILLKATQHYIFLSSSRVYANSVDRLTEKSNRLLDVSKDEEFLKTQRYALRKARQEDLIKDSEYDNWTIVRPYITYSDERLQLGIYEKEEWLYRLMNDKSLIIRKDILEKETTLTYGYDVAYGIYKLLENKKSKMETVHIVSNETIKWKEILKIYVDIIRNSLNKDVRIYTSNHIEQIEELFEGGYNTKYDRLYDRRFDNSKAELLCGQIEYLPVRTGIERCLNNFIKKIDNQKSFKNINLEYESCMDKLTEKENIIKLSDVEELKI